MELWPTAEQQNEGGNANTRPWMKKKHFSYVSYFHLFWNVLQNDSWRNNRNSWRRMQHNMPSWSQQSNTSPASNQTNIVPSFLQNNHPVLMWQRAQIGTCIEWDMDCPQGHALVMSHVKWEFMHSGINMTTIAQHGLPIANWFNQLMWQVHQSCWSVVAVVIGTTSSIIVLGLAVLASCCCHPMPAALLSGGPDFGSSCPFDWIHPLDCVCPLFSLNCC